MTPDRARDIITRRLHPGERLIWHDAPNPWRIALLYILFIPNLYFGFIFVIIASRSFVFSEKTSIVWAIFLFSFAAALGTAAVLAIRKIFNAWRTAYGLTDKRVIVAVGASKTESHEPLELQWMRRNHSGARGDIILTKPDFVSQPEPLYWRILRDPNGFYWRSLRRTAPHDKPGLYSIRDPARIEALIRETLLKPHTEGAPA